MVSEIALVFVRALPVATQILLRTLPRHRRTDLRNLAFLHERCEQWEVLVFGKTEVCARAVLRFREEGVR